MEEAEGVGRGSVEVVAWGAACLGDSYSLIFVVSEFNQEFWVLELFLFLRMRLQIDLRSNSCRHHRITLYFLRHTLLLLVLHLNSSSFWHFNVLAGSSAEILRLGDFQ